MTDADPEQGAPITAIWKPAAARPAVTGRLEDGVLSTFDARGTLRWRLPLDQVREINLRVSHSRSSSHYQLDLRDRGGQRRRIAFDTLFSGDTATEAQLDFLRHVLAALVASRPDLPVILGLTGPMRMTVFLLGIAMLALGLVAMVVVYRFGEGGAELWSGLAMGAALVFVGLGMVARNLPGQEPPRMALRDWLETHAEFRVLRSGDGQ